MNKKMFFNRSLAAVVLGLIITTQPLNVFSHTGGKKTHGESKKVTVRHDRYHYRHGNFYKPLWFGLFEIKVKVPPVGAVITVLPAGHRTIMSRGVKYYYYDNIYYTAYPGGYVVVPAPAADDKVVLMNSTVVKSQETSGETVTVNVPNSNGSYTAVTLVKQKDGYTGPQGEYYPGSPTVEQLKVLYGK